MPIDVDQWLVQVKGIVFHQFDCLSSPQPILDLLDTVPNVFDKLAFDGEITANRISDRFRQRKLKSAARNWTKVRREVQAGAISTLYFDTTTKGYASVAFQMFHVLNNRSEEYTSEGYDSVSFLLEDRLIREQIVDLSKCVHFLKQAWQMLDGIYGFLDVFISNRRGSMLPHVVQEAADHFRVRAYNSFVDFPKANLHIHVPDVYWVNFLNTNHAKAIGGLGLVRSRLSEATVVPLAHDGLFVQISPSPFYERYDKRRFDHDELERLLVPILEK
jgi:hypothetical protein